MKSHELFHITGGGIFLGSIFLKGGVYDSGQVGGPVLQVFHEAFDKVGQSLVKQLADVDIFDGLVFRAQYNGGYNARTRRTALAQISAGGQIKVASRDRTVWTGTATA